MNNKHLMQQLEHYNATKKYHINEKEGMMSNLHADKLFKELDQEQETPEPGYDYGDFVRLDLLSELMK
jgi:hypothetical protein